MPDSELSVKFGADVSELSAGAAQAKKLVGDLSTPMSEVQLRASGLAQSLVDAFNKISGAAPSASIGILGKAIDVLAGSAGAAGNDLSGIGAILGEVAGASTGLGAALGALGAVFSAVQAAVRIGGAVLQQTAKALDWSGEISDTAAALGISVESLQQYRSAAESAGVKSSDFVSSMSGLGTTLGSVQGNLSAATPQMQAFSELGISPAQLRGFTSVDQLLPAIADGLKNAGSEAERAAIADRLGIRPLLPLLEKGSAGLETLKGSARDAGGEIDSKTAASMRQFKADTDRAAEAITGNLNMAFLVLAPLLRSTMNLLDEFSIKFSNFMQSFVGIQNRTSQALEAHKAWLENEIRNATPDPGKTASERDKPRLAELKADLENVDAELKSRDAAAASAAPTPAPAPPKPAPAAVSGPPKGSGGVSSSGSQVEQWADQLHQQELKAAADSGDYMQDQTAAELAFWQRKLTQTRASSSDWYAVQDRIFSLMKSRQSAANDDLIAGDKDRIDADKGNWSQDLADWNKYLSDIAAAAGKGSAEYAGALKEMQAAEREHDDAILDARTRTIEQQASAEKQSDDQQLATLKASIATRIETLKTEASAGLISRSQEAAQVQALQQQQTDAELLNLDIVYNAQMSALRKITGDRIQADQDVSDLLAQQTALTADYTDKQTAIMAEGLKQQDADRLAALTKFKSEWDGFVDPMVSGFSKGLLDMAQGTKSFSQEFKAFGQEMLNDMLKVIDSLLEKWLWKEIGQTVATVTGNAQRTASNEAAAVAGNGAALAQTLLTIKQDAAKVFGGVFAALAGNPATLPAALPVASAAAATVMGVRVAKGGWGNVPFDNMPTLLHAQEMVLPATLANPMRAMLAGFSGADGQSGARLAGGDTHVHNWSVSAIDARGVQGFFDQHADKLFRTLNGKLRGGATLAV